MKDRIDAIVQAFLDHQAMEETRSYLERGRPFEGLADDALGKQWAAAFTAGAQTETIVGIPISTIWEPSLACETSRGPRTLSILGRCRPLRSA